jgi:hypothetical protein
LLMAPVALLLLLTALAPQPDCKPQFAPLETGSTSGVSTVPFWRRAEGGEWGGGGWLGWTWTGDTLRSVSLLVRDHPKDRQDDEDEVTVESVPKVTFAVRCIPQLRVGRIRTAGVSNESLDPAKPLKLAMGSRRYELRLEPRREDHVDAKVILTDGRTRQTLYSVDGFADEPHFHIIWAGDLDRDGKLDLIVNLSRKYSVHPYRLLLSSKASGQDIVGEAAVFETGD